MVPTKLYSSWTKAKSYLDVCPFAVSLLDDPDSLMELYVILRSIERFYSEYKEYPGSIDDHVEPDLVKLKVRSIFLK